MLICDFCSAPNPIHSYACKTFRPSDFPIAQSVEGWAACDECAALIDADRWEELADAKTFMERNYYPAADLESIRAFMLKLHSEFRANRKP